MDIIERSNRLIATGKKWLITHMQISTGGTNACFYAKQYLIQIPVLLVDKIKKNYTESTTYSPQNKDM